MLREDVTSDLTSRFWITHVQAAELLGVHLTAVGKMVKRGELHPRRVRRSLPSLDRAEVEALAEQRRDLNGQMLIQRAERDSRRRRPPDTEHDWLSVVQAASLLGVSRTVVHKRLVRGDYPFAWSGDSRWFRRDLLR